MATLEAVEFVFVVPTTQQVLPGTQLMEDRFGIEIGEGFIAELGWIKAAAEVLLSLAIATQTPPLPRGMQLTERTVKPRSN